MIKILVNGVLTDIADVTSVGTIAKIGGTYQIFSGSGWLTCDGSAVSRSTYAALFAAIGTIFGSGDGVNTFNLPTQSQAGRVTISITTSQTLTQFTADADVVVNNPSAAFIDISAGAAGPGIRISIIEQSTSGITIYTDAGHTQYCLLPKGVILLEWDGSQWCLVGGQGRILMQFTSSQSWKTPFEAVYAMYACGGGGGGGGVPGTGMQNTAGGGGGGGAASTFSKRWPAATPLTVVIGAAGAGGAAGSNPGGAGGATSVSDGTVTISASGGSGGAGAAGTGSQGAGGSGGQSTIPPGVGAIMATGAAGNTGGAGGTAPWSVGTPGPYRGSNGAGYNASGYSAGGGNAFGNNSGAAAGGNGAPGVAYISF